MSNANERLIDNYEKEVKLIHDLLALVNATQADRVERIYNHAYKERVLSDQDFYEAINWYVRKCISIAVCRSLRASRKYDFTKIRFWNSVIIAIVPLLGDYPFYETNSMRVNLETMMA